MLTAPRVYFAMARDGVFFKRIGELGTRSRVPVAAIVLQGVCASAIALWGRFDQVLNYVVSIDVLFFGLTGAALLVYRRRADADAPPPIKVPLHPLTTIAFVAACWAISITTIVNAPRDAGGGVAILAIGVPVYFWWARRQTTDSARSAAASRNVPHLDRWRSARQQPAPTANQTAAANKPANARTCGVTKQRSPGQDKAKSMKAQDHSDRPDRSDVQPEVAAVRTETTTRTMTTTTTTITPVRSSQQSVMNGWCVA